MNGEKDFEPEISMIDHDAGIASIAISLKRIADEMKTLNKNLADICRELRDILI